MSLRVEAIRAEFFDDAIHCVAADGLLCGSEALGRRTLRLAAYPTTDVGGSYCWTCLEVANRLRDAP